MDFKEVLDYCKAEAILNTLQATEESVWRTICRSYSQHFATPLHMCLDGTIDPIEIIKAEFERQLEDFDEEKDLEAMLDQIYLLEDPEYEKEKREELANFIKKIEKEEAERIRLGKPIHKGIKAEPELDSPSRKKLPKQGGVNFSYLANQESEG